MRTAGFYRVWTHDGTKNTACQIAAIKVFNSKLERASDNQNNVIVLGDANISIYLLKKIKNKLLLLLSLLSHTSKI